ETVIATISRTAQVVLDMGHSRTLMLIFCDGRLQTARTCSYGGKHLIEAIRRKYNISAGEATKIFQERGFILTSRDGANEDQIFFSETIVGALKPLIDELKISLLDLKSELRVNFEKIGILGGVSGLQNISAYLTSQLELPVNQIRHFEKHPKIEIPYQEPTERIAATAIGLALEGFKRPRNPAIQLRRGEFAKQSQRAKFFFEKWSRTLTLCGFALLGLFVYSYTRVLLTEEMVISSEDRIRTLAKGPPAMLKGSAMSVSGLQKFVREKTKEINTQKTLAQTRFINSPLDLIEELSSRSPQNKEDFPLEIKRIRIVDDLMEIEGDLALPQQVTQLKALLKNLSQDQKVVDIKSKFPAPPNRMAFAYSLKAKRKPKGVDSGL
ncbi:MAG: cell division FtsA domain-containing protein, partial [Bdellovibrionales bacterium]|nr:cell division FtsA domain-containing protein [Bdellovibrionales bacterium]